MNRADPTPAEHPQMTDAPAPGGLDWRDGPMAEGLRAMAGFPPMNRRTPGTCPYCGVMSPFPHDVTCPRSEAAR
jgi:hypothetical protein